MLPENAHDPPTRAVVEELKAVDAACEGFLTLGMARFVGTPHVSDAVPALDTIGYIDVRLPTDGPPTLYGRAGDWVFLALLIAGLASVLSRLHRPVPG